MKNRANVVKFAQETYRKLEESGETGRVRKTIEAVNKRFKLVVSNKFVRYWCVEKMSEIAEKLDESIHALDDAIEETKFYETEGENVIFYVKKKLPSGEDIVQKYTIPFLELEEIWYDYSQHGKNLSGKNVLIKHGIKRATLSLLRSRLGLTKDENAVPQVVLDYWAETYGEKAVEDKIVEVTHRAMDDKYKRKFVLADKRETDRLVRLGSDFKAQLEAFREILENYEPKKVEYVSEKRSENPGTLNVFFSDLHFGNSNDSDIVKRFDEMYRYIVSQPQGTVNINCLGDLGENFAPNGMHDGQIRHMSMHGRKLTMFIVNVFEKFLIGIHNSGKSVTFRGKGGNHDRVSEQHGVDDEKTMAWVIYEFIARGLKNFDILVDYYMEDISTFGSGGLHFITHHGDNKFSNRKPEDILWKNGDQTKYCVIIHGDKHNLTIKETKQATMIGLPALAGRGTYDTMLDLHSEPGMVIVTENSSGTADVFVKRLP